MKTVPLNVHTNVPIMCTAAGISKYRSFTAYFNEVDSTPVREYCMVATPKTETITDDDFLHGLEGEVRQLDDLDNKTSATNDQAELVRWHY